MDDLIKEFVVETYENLDMLDRAMVELEKDPQHKPSLDNIFRTIHTLKGTCGFVNCGRLEKLAHVGENLLGRIREGSLLLTAERASALLSMVDAVRHAMSVLERTGSEPELNYEEHIQKLVRLTDSDAPEILHEDAGVGVPSPRAEPPGESVSSTELNENTSAVCDPEPEPSIQETTDGERRKGGPATEVSAARLLNVATTEEETRLHAGTAIATTGGDQSLAKHTSLSESTIRVDVSILDKLMNLVGELVLARNQIVQFSEALPDKSFHSACQRLNLITSEVQANFMKTRMQPIENVFGKFPRIVRDLCTDLGKRVRIEMSGNQTELDRTIIEAIKDPLTHIVRNSVDHGIELPERREASGKQAEGVLSLRAYHEGGQVNIEIRDDGAGINVERVKQKAVDKGLITAEQAQRMTEREAFNLIFLPGFSTVEKITNLSGRGVGMDVVKTNIEKIGGIVDLQSQPGEGTTLKIKIPLTLAIIPALIVTSSGDRFAIPQVSLLELVRLEADQARNQIEFIHGVPVYRLRGQLLPLVYLSRELKIATRAKDASALKTGDGEAVNIVVMQADRHPFGLVVDEINDTEEIVVKPLGKQLKGVACFAGATIMGDGRVALILDVLGLAQRASVVAEERGRTQSESSGHGRKTADPGQTLLLFEVGQEGRMAIPLSVVARLEEFSQSSIEHSGAQEVVRYRGQILPLIRISKHVSAAGGAAPPEEADPMQVIVYSEQGRSVGLVVERIYDIVQETIAVKRHAHAGGIFGSVVIQERVTDLLDFKAVIRSADPSFYGDKQPAPTAA